MVRGLSESVDGVPPQLLNVSIVWIGIINSIYTSNAIYNVSTERLKQAERHISWL